MATDRPWLESLAACVPHGLAFVKADGVLLWANQPFCRIVGAGGAVKGTAASQWLPGWEALIAGGAGRIPLQLHRPDGTEIAAVLHVARCREGVDAAWAVHLEDVSELSDLRQRLEARERSYSFLRENTSDFILRTNEHLTVLWTNAPAPSPFREGARLAELLAPESFEPLARAMADPATDRLAVTLCSPRGMRPPFALVGVARRLTDESGALLGCTLLLRDDSEKQAFARFVAKHSLTPREEEVILHVMQGYSNLNIATILGLSESGVKFHLRNVFTRARVATRTELMAEVMNA